MKNHNLEAWNETVNIGARAWLNVDGQQSRVTIIGRAYVLHGQAVVLTDPAGVQAISNLTPTTAREQ